MTAPKTEVTTKRLPAEASDAPWVPDPAVDQNVRGNREDEMRARTSDDGTFMSIEERLAILREEHTGDVLPNVNLLPGRDDEMHYFWASTTNQTDPIYKRLRLGYQLVRAIELPALEADFRIKDGQFEGCVSVNEMLLLKIPKRLYQELMLINHHEKPLAEEERLKEEAVQNQEDRAGKKLGMLDEEDQGYTNIVHRRRAPTFV